jgi:hypothetical protein
MRSRARPRLMDGRAAGRGRPRTTHGRRGRLTTKVRRGRPRTDADGRVAPSQSTLLTRRPDTPLLTRHCSTPSYRTCDSDAARARGAAAELPRGAPSPRRTPRRAAGRRARPPRAPRRCASPRGLWRCSTPAGVVRFERERGRDAVSPLRPRTEGRSVTVPTRARPGPPGLRARAMASQRSGAPQLPRDRAATSEREVRDLGAAPRPPRAPLHCARAEYGRDRHRRSGVSPPARPEGRQPHGGARRRAAPPHGALRARRTRSGWRSARSRTAPTRRARRRRCRSRRTRPWTVRRVRAEALPRARAPSGDLGCVQRR